MKTCEVCQTSLTQADIDRGRCPTCRHLLVSTGDDDARTAATIQAPSPSSPESQRDKGTADDDLVARTLAAAGIAPQTEPGASFVPKSGGTEINRFDVTLAPSNSGGTARSPLTEVDFSRIAATIDSANLSPEMVRHVTAAWAGKLDSGTSPETSIKSHDGAVDEDERHTIPPRAISDARTPGDDRTPDAAKAADYELLSNARRGRHGRGLCRAAVARSTASWPSKKIKQSEAGNTDFRQKFLCRSGRHRRTRTPEYRARSTISARTSPARSSTR